MGFELEKRFASELNRLADEASHDRPSKHVERLKRIAAELQAKLRGTVELGEDAPGKRTAVDDMVESAVRKLDSITHRARGFDTLPWQQAQRATFDDYRATGLREVLSRLSDRRLRGATLASAEPAIAAKSGSSTKVQPNAAGQAMWRAAERRAATLYRHAMDNGEVAGEDPIVDEALERCGSGQSLPLAVRKQMEAELGISLSRVRVHTDKVANAAAKAVRAEAFTVGEDIFFAEGFFAPDSREGRKLLAHELTHVVQSYQGRTALGGSGIHVSQPGEVLEREADAVADRIAERPRRAERRTADARAERPRARGSSAEIAQAPVVAPTKQSRAAHVQRRAENGSALDAEGPRKRTNDPNKRGQLPNLVIERDRPGERTKREAKKGADPIRDGAKKISAQVKNVVSGAVSELKSTATQVKQKGVGKTAKTLAKQQGKLSGEQKKEAKKTAKAANDAAKSAAKHDGKGKVRPPERGGEFSGVGAIQLKPISDWNKYMPAEMPDQDQRERKRILGLVKNQINGDRKQSATLLNQLHKAHLSQAKDVRGMLPGLKSEIQGGQSKAIGQVSAAEGAQTSAVQAHVAGVTAQVRATATQMVGQINGAFRAAMSAIRDAKQSATQKLQDAQTQALSDIDIAETMQVALVNMQFAMTGVRIMALGAAKASQASGRGDSYPLDYDGDKLEAARKAAREVAAEYAKAMPQEAAKAFKQVDAERPKTISDIRKMAADQRKQVREAFKQCKQTVDDAAQQAEKGANEMKTSAVGQVQSTASTTASQLTAHGASQVAAIRQQAAGARAGIQKAGAAAIHSVTDGINKAAQGLEKGAAGLVKGARMMEVASVEETKKRCTEGMQQLGEAGRSISQGMKKSASGAVSGMTQQAQGAAQGMAQTGAAAKQAASQMGQGANQAMSQIAQGSSQGLQQLGQNFKKSADEIAGKGKEAMKGIADGLKEAYTAAGQQLREGLSGAVDNVRSSFDEAVLPQEDKAIAENAKKAADAVKPWWQKALAFVVSIVVAIVVVVVVTALIVTTGPIGAILVGAAAGALGSVLGQMASNLVLGNGLMDGITWQTVAMGAVGGAIGAGFTSAITAGAQRFGATAVTSALKGGTGVGAFGIRTGVGVAGDFVSDAATQLIFTGGYQFSMENLVTSLVTNSVTSTKRYDTMQDSFQSGLRNQVGHIEIGRTGTGPAGADGTPRQTIRDQVDVSVHGPGKPVTNQGGGDYGGAHVAGDGTTPGGTPRTQAPRTNTGGDAPRTNTGGDAPRTNTGGDAPGGDRTAAGGDRTTAGGDRTTTGGDRTTTGGDRTNTGGDRTQSGDRTQQADGDRGGNVTRKTDGGDETPGTQPKTSTEQGGNKGDADADGPRTAKGEEPKRGGDRKQGTGDKDGGADDGAPPARTEQGGEDKTAAPRDEGGDATPDGPESAAADQLSDLGYPNPTRAKADQAASAIEGGGRPPPDTIRDTDANQQGLKDLDQVQADPNLKPESKQNINRDVANGLRTEEPTGNLQRDVAQAKTTEQARLDAEAAAKGGDKSGGETDPNRIPTKEQADALKPMYEQGAKAKVEIDTVADQIATELGGSVAKAPLKSEGRVVEKANNDYGGDVTRVTDVARNTIIVKGGSEAKALARLRELYPDIPEKNIKQVSASEDPLGYSGTLVKLPTKTGGLAEIQINSPEMIYAKEGPENARRILGDETYDRLANTAGMPEGGLGHSMYEAFRASNDPALKDTIAADSRAYYDQVRAAARGGEPLTGGRTPSGDPSPTGGDRSPSTAKTEPTATIETQGPARPDVQGEGGQPPKLEATGEIAKGGLFTKAKALEGDVFGPKGPQPGDVAQGALGDCYLLATLQAVAKRNPQLIRDMIRANPDGTYTVTFRTQASSKMMPDGTRVQVPEGTKEVTVTPLVPQTRIFGGEIYASSKGDGGNWPQIIEKAYAQEYGGDKGYKGIGEGGYPSEVMNNLFGLSGEARSGPTDGPGSPVLKQDGGSFPAFKQMFDGGSVMVAATKAPQKWYQKLGLGSGPVPSHAWAVMDVSVDPATGQPMIELFNPHNTNGKYGSQFKITYDAFLKDFDWMYYTQ